MDRSKKIHGMHELTRSLVERLASTSREKNGAKRPPTRETRQSAPVGCWVDPGTQQKVVTLASELKMRVDQVVAAAVNIFIAQRYTRRESTEARDNRLRKALNSGKHHQP